MGLLKITEDGEAMTFRQMVMLFQGQEPDGQSRMTDFMLEECPETFQKLLESYPEDKLGSFFAGMAIMADLVRRYGIPDDIDKMFTKLEVEA